MGNVRREGVVKSWVKGYFVGRDNVYEQAYKWIATDEQARKDVDGIIKLLRPRPGASIIDWCGGWGRHSIELAKRGFEVTLIDISPQYIERAKASAQNAGVKINAVCADFRKRFWEFHADYAINMFTAGVGYFNEEDDIVALHHLFDNLAFSVKGTNDKEEPKILIDTTNLFWLIKNFKDKREYSSPDGHQLRIEESEFDPHTNRVKSKVVFRDNFTMSEKTRLTDHRVYSFLELKKVIERYGKFKVTDVYGGVDGSEFNVNSKRMVVIAKLVPVFLT